MPDESTEVGPIVVVGVRGIPLGACQIADWFTSDDPGGTTSNGPYTEQPTYYPCTSTVPVTGPVPGDVALIRRAAQELRAAMEAQSTYNRHEWGGVIFLMPNGGYYASPPVTSRDADIVRINASALVPPGGVLVAWVHTHPADGTWQGSPSTDDWQSRDRLAAASFADPNLITYVVDLAGADKMREYLANASRSQTARGPVINC